jgi:hypothetical protein
MKTEMWTWMRVQFFRFWTALVVLGAYGYFWLNTPEYLTWWKRRVNTLIEKGCDMLSYPWGDRIESTVGNFGIWVQITLAILIFRTIIGTVLILIRAIGREALASSGFPAYGSHLGCLTANLSDGHG